jgi:hypothetical protein
MVMMPMRARRSKLTGLSMAVHLLPVASDGSIETNRLLVNIAEFNSALWNMSRERSFLSLEFRAGFGHSAHFTYLMVILPSKSKIIWKLLSRHK